MPTQIIHATGLNGLFRVVAIGRLTLGIPFDPRIKLLFRRVERFEGTGHGQPRAVYGPEMASLAIPMGEMLSLGVGTTIDSDRVVESPDVRELVIEVDFRGGLEGCMTRRELQQSGLLEAFEDCPAVQDVCPEESWWYLAPCLDPQFEFVLTPAPLLYTAFYAPTSRLAGRILAGDVNELASAFVDSQKTRPLTSGRHGEIHLRRGVVRAEALPISRAWYEPAFHDRMCSVHSSVAVSSISGAPAGLRVAPPPTGSTVRLRVKALTWRPRGKSRPSLVVLAILDSDELLPFRTLDVHLDQTEAGLAEQVSPNTGNSGPGRRPPSDFLGLFCKLDGNDTRPGDSPPKVVVIETPSVCFSTLDKLKITRRKRGQSKQKRKPPKIETTTNTTQLRSGGSGDPSNQRTDLSQSGGNYAEDGAQGEEGKSPMEALEGLIGAVRHLGSDHGVSVVSRVVTLEAMGYREFVMNELRRPEQVRSSNWFFLSGTTLPRPILLLELRLKDRYSLLLEIIRNPGEHFSSLFVVKPSGGQFHDSELRSLILLVEHAQQVPKNIVISAAIGGSREQAAEIIRYRHGSDPEALADRIAERLNAVAANP